MRSCLPQEEVFQIVGCAIEGLNPWSWNSWEAIRKMHWSWSLAAKNSIPATARIRRCLQRPESWSVRPWPSRFRFCCGGASGEDKLGGTSLARRSRRRWGQWVPSRRRAQPTAPTNLLSPKKAWWLLSLGCASCSIKERRFLCAIISTRTRSQGVRDGLVQDELVSGWRRR